MAEEKKYQYGYNPEELEKKIYAPEKREMPWGFFARVVTGQNYDLQQIFVRQGENYSQQNHLNKEVLFYLEAGAAAFTVFDGTGNQHQLKMTAGETLLIPQDFSFQIFAVSDSYFYLFADNSSKLFDVLAAKSFFKKGQTFDRREKWWAENMIETIINKEYTGKKIFFQQGNSSSLHFHCQKTETYFIHSGRLLLRLRAGQGEDRFFILNPGQAITITPGMMHQAGGLKDTVIIEASTHDEDSDSYIVEGEREAMPKLDSLIQRSDSFSTEDLRETNERIKKVPFNNTLSKPYNVLKKKNKSMKLFLDTANLEEIERGLKMGIFSGITTNPSLIAKEPKSNFLDHIKKIVALCRQYGQELPISIEVFETEPQKIVAQAKEFIAVIGYEKLNIKIPIGWTELAAISELSKMGIKINCTCGFNEAQAILAANAGAKYFSLFYGRLKDIGVEPAEVIKRTKELLVGTETEIIMGSIRHMKDLVDSFVAGAHIVTAPLSIFEKMAVHPKTKESVDQFLNEFKQWINQ